jgi:hypothetical protein
MNDPTRPEIETDDEALTRLHAYWAGKCRGRRMPSRADIDPLDFGYILGWVMLVDVVYDPLRFKFRIYGSELVQRMGFDITGKYLSDHPSAEFRGHVEQQWRQVAEKGAASHSRFDRWIDGRHMRFESLRLPLSSDGTTVDMILVAVRHLDVTE